MSVHSKTRSIILLMILLVSVITIAATFFTYSYYRKQTLDSLNKRVTSFAVALDANEIKNLNGTKSDLDNPNYDNLKTKLMTLQEFNDDTRFIYLMGQRGNELFFYADSEPADSEDYSPPGQVYEEASEVMWVVLSEQTVQTEIGSDRWGKWLSVMAPVIDPETNSAIALVGFDIPYNDYNIGIILSTLLPFTVGLVVIIFLIASLIYAKKDEQLLHLRSEYFAIAAHDLRSPLTGIKWAVASLQKLTPEQLQKKSQTLLAQIGTSTENMLTSVSELLDGASLDKNNSPQLSLTDVEVNNLLQVSFDMLSVAARGKKIMPSWKLPKAVILRADRDKLRRVFSNIFSNAIKYTPQGGKISVSTKSDKKNITITITDSGIGIPQSEQNKIFSGYYRASNAKEHTPQGTGLGLYYVKNIIALHGGTVSIQSEQNRGTTIILQLPLP